MMGQRQWNMGDGRKTLWNVDDGAKTVEYG